MDENFRVWVWKPTNESNKFWRSWISKHPDKSEEVEEAIELLRKLSFPDYSLSETEVVSLWENIKNSSRSGNVFYTKPKANRWWLTVAAILTTAIISFLYMSNMSSTHRYETSYGETRTLLLPDSSTVILNANSIITFNTDWDEKVAREVWLDGEAFFEVVHTRNHQPFQVKVGDGLAVEVLGTSFTIKANPEIEEERVVVKTGRVSVVSQLESNTIEKGVHFSEANGIVVTPNQEAIYLSSNAKLMKRIVPTPTILSSTLQKQEFIYKNASLAKVFTDLEKAYGIKIIYDENLFEECTINGNLSDATMFDKLNSIAKITGINYQVVDAQIIVSGKGCD